MSFLEIRFPESISFESSTILEFNTSIITSKNGNEQRNVNWQYNKMKYNNELTNSNSTNSLIRSTIMTKEKEEYLNNLYQDYQKRQDKLRSKQNEINNYIK